jgi:acyl-CoA oxidase
MTERGHGSNVRDIETVARFEREHDSFVLDSPTDTATKDWIGNAALHGRIATVFAQLDVGGVGHGVHAFLVPIRDAGGRPMPGVAIEDCGPKEGLNGVDNGRIRFERVRIPRDALLDRFGQVDDSGEYISAIPSAGRRFLTMLGTLVGGRVSIAAASVSVAKTALTIAIRYSSRRRQFGPSEGEEVPLLEYLAHQRLLLPRLARTYALHFACRDLTRRYAEVHGVGTPESPLPPESVGTAEGENASARPPGDAEATELARRELEVLAAAIKAEASRHALDTLQAAREACGGRGYHADNRFGRLKADADVFATFEGANAVLLQLAAKGLLSRYRTELGDLRFGGWVRLVAESAKTRVVELNPLIVRKTDEDHLLDPEFHADALRYRESRLLSSAARRLRALVGSGIDSFDAVNQVQDHLLELANAHADRVIAERFHGAVAEAGDGETGRTLGSLAALHALTVIEAARGWYLEAGYMEPAKTRAIRGLVNRLCGDIATIAPELVHAFAIPDEILRAPDGLLDLPAASP